MTANPLTELAERVERLTGPCRETDALIAAHCHPTVDPREAAFENGRDYPDLYTASLDAAMTLVPEGHLWTMDSWSSERWAVGIWKPLTGRWLIYSSKANTSRTPTLALASAALHSRARAALENSHG